MRLIMRADDVGYSDVANIGTFKTIDEGVITSADVMLDCPGAPDALKKLRERPWIGLGWHAAHCWGSPVLGAAQVPSLVNDRGWFKWTLKDGVKLGGWETPPTREALAQKMNEVNYDEALAEFRAEIMMCVDLYGRAPDCASGPMYGTLVNEARRQVCEEFGIKYGWFTKGPGGRFADGQPCEPQYRSLDVFMPCQENGTNRYLLDCPAPYQPEKYDPIAAFKADADHIQGHETVQVAFHPAFVDDYLAFDGGFQFNMHRIRLLDVHAMCAPELKNWIREQNITLVSCRDVLTGSNDYQNHLRLIGSSLFMG